jgi:hypothetical protein
MFQHDAYKLKGGLRQARLQLAKSENITRDQSIVVKVIIGTLILEGLSGAVRLSRFYSDTGNQCR